MSSHRFEPGERVSYSEKRFPNGVISIELFVVAQLTRGGEPHYQLRAAESHREFVLPENDLRPRANLYGLEAGVPSPWSA